MNSIIDKVYEYFNKKISKKDIKFYLKCQDKEDFKPMYETNLYRNKSGLYCHMQEVICWIKEGKLVPSSPYSKEALERKRLSSLSIKEFVKEKGLKVVI